MRVEVFLGESGRADYTLGRPPKAVLEAGCRGLRPEAPRKIEHPKYCGVCLICALGRFSLPSLNSACVQSYLGPDHKVIECS
jgi:hypothetical protein